MVQIGTPGNRRNRTTTGREDSCTPTIGANKTVSGCNCWDDVVEVFFNRNSTGSDATVHGLADGDPGQGQKQDQCFHKLSRGAEQENPERSRYRWCIHVPLSSIGLACDEL